MQGMSEIGNYAQLSSYKANNQDNINKLVLEQNVTQIFKTSGRQNNDDLQRINLELIQKISLLEKERDEMIERELNLKKINEQIMEAFNTLNTNTFDNSNKDINILEDRHQKEMHSIKKRLESTQNMLEQEKVQNLYKIAQLQNENNSQKIQIENLKTELQKNQHQLNTINSKYEQLQKSSNTEKRKLLTYLLQRSLLDEIENQWKTKVQQLEKQIEKDKIESNSQIQIIQKEADNNLENLKILHSHEKHLLWTKLNGVQNEKNTYQDSIEQNLDLYNQLNNKHKLDRDQLLQEMNQLNKKIQQLEQENLKIQQQEMLELKHENEIKQIQIIFDEERKIQNQKIKELNSQIKKSEQIEKKYTNILKERDIIIEDIKKEHQKKLYYEKKKTENLQEAANKIKEDYTKKNAFVIQEVLSKEEHIKKLNKELMKQSISISKIYPAKANSMTTWFDPNMIIDTSKINQQNNQQHFISILNQEGVTDMNFLSNNFCSETNNNTYLQEFPQNCISQRNIMTNSIDDKFYKIQDQQYISAQQQYNQKEQSNTLQMINYNQSQQSQQQNNYTLNDNAEKMYCSSPLIHQKEQKMDHIFRQDRIQETQNESEDPSFDNQFIKKVDNYNKQNEGFDIFTMKQQSVGYMSLNKNSNPTINNSLPTSFRQTFEDIKHQGQTNVSSSNQKIKQKTTSYQKIASSDSKNNHLQQQKQLYSHRKSASIQENKQKTINSSSVCQTTSQSKNKTIHTQSLSESKDFKRNISLSCHSNQKQQNGSNKEQNLKLQSYQHKNNILKIFKNDQNITTNQLNNYQDQLYQTPKYQTISQRYNSCHQNSSCQQIKSSHQNSIQNNTSQYTNQQQNQQNVQKENKQNILQDKQQNNQDNNIQTSNNNKINQYYFQDIQKQQNAVKPYSQNNSDEKLFNYKNNSSDSLYSYHYNQKQNYDLQQQVCQQLPLQSNVDQVYIQPSNSIKYPQVRSRQSSIFKQAELFSHINNLIVILKQKSDNLNSNLSQSELNYVRDMVQQQVEDFTGEEISQINKLLQMNNTQNIISYFEKIRNRIMGNRGQNQSLVSKQKLQAQELNQTFSKNENQGSKVSDIFDRLYKNLQHQTSITNHLQTDNSENCATLQTLPNEHNEISGCINPVRTFEKTKTNIHSSSNFATKQNSQFITSNLNIQQVQNNIKNNNDFEHANIKTNYFN